MGRGKKTGNRPKQLQTTYPKGEADFFAFATRLKDCLLPRKQVFSSISYCHGKETACEFAQSSRPGSQFVIAPSWTQTHWGFMSSQGSRSVSLPWVVKKWNGQDTVCPLKALNEVDRAAIQPSKMVEVAHSLHAVNPWAGRAAEALIFETLGLGIRHARPAQALSLV